MNNIPWKIPCFFNHIAQHYFEYSHATSSINCLNIYQIFLFYSTLLHACGVFHLSAGWEPCHWGMTSQSHVLYTTSLWKQHAHTPHHVIHSLMSSESDGAPSCRRRKKLSVPSQANNNKPGAGFQRAFSLKWDTATRITNISLVLSSGPGPWKNYSKYLPRFIWNPGIG